MGMTGRSARGGPDIRPRPLHHGDTEQEELEKTEETNTLKETQMKTLV